MTQPSPPHRRPPDRDPAELTTGELLVASRRPLAETGDADRAARARRIARLYLERRQRRIREQLHHDG